MYNERKTSGMTLLQHLAVRAGRNRKKNPNGVIGITIGDADKIIQDFKQMRKERDDAIAALSGRLPKEKAKRDKAESKIAPRWAAVIKNIK